MMASKMWNCEDTHLCRTVLSVGVAIGLVVLGSHVLAGNSVVLPEDTTSIVLGGALFEDCACWYHGDEAECWALIPITCNTNEDCVGCADDASEYRCDEPLKPGSYSCLERPPHYCFWKTWKYCREEVCVYEGQGPFEDPFTSCSESSPNTVKQCELQ